LHHVGVLLVFDFGLRRGFGFGVAFALAAAKQKCG
jgi:hypothetical protein